MKEKIIGFFSVFAVVLGFYLYTMAPTVSFWDCGEFITCSYILGVPHPPGTPFFVVLGRLFTLLPLSKEIAFRVNFLSGLSGAIAAAILYLLILKVIVRIKENREEKPSIFVHIIAGFSAILGALAFSVWDNSVEAEVYSISTLVLVLGLWTVLHWDDNRGTKGNKNTLLLLIYLTFLGMGIHLLPLLVLPGALVFVLMVNWKELKDPKFLAIAIGLVALGITTYAYLMIRARLNPAINEADPRTFKALWDVFTRKQYGPMKMFPRKTQPETGLSLIPAFWEQIKIYLKYFSWQYFPYPREKGVSTLVSILSLIGTYIYSIIGIWGMVVHYRREKKSFWLFFITFLLLSFGLVVYLNLRFSPSDPNPAHKPREVRERDYFFAPSYFLFAFYIGIAMFWFRERLRKYLKKKKACADYGIPALAGIMVLLTIISNINSHVNRRGNWIAHDYAYNMLISADENSVVFTNGDNDTFPLWFMQYVKHFKEPDLKNKKGVMLANLSLLNTNWYIKQLKLAGVPIDFDSPFRGTRVEQKYNRAVKSGRYKGTFEEFVIDNLYPTKDKSGKLLLVKDIAIKDMILASCGIKPTLDDLLMPYKEFVEKYINSDVYKPSINIYFSATVALESRKPYQEHLKLEGFLYKLVPEKGYDMVDIPKTKKLLTEEFKYRSIFDPRVYKDENTTRLLGNYSALFFTLGRKMRMQVIPSPYVLDPTTYANIKPTDKKKQILKEAANVFIQGMKFTDEQRILGTIAIELRAILSVLKDYKTALDILNRLESTKPDAMIYMLKGDIYREMGKLNEAEKYLQKAMQLNKDDPGVYYSLLKLYSQLNRPDKVSSILTKMLSNPRLFSSTFSLARTVGDTAVMVEMLKLVTEVYPNEKDAKTYLDTLLKHWSKRNKLQ